MSQFFRIKDFKYNTIAQHSGQLNNLWTDQLDGIIIRQVISPSVLSTFLTLLSDPITNLPRTSYYWGQVYGRVLTSQLDDLDEYYSDAAAYNINLPAIWGDDNNTWPEFFSEMLQLLHGRNADVPQFTNEKCCTSSTIRIIADGSELTTHCGNQFAYKSSKFDDLKKISLLDNQVSYFLLLQEPSEGGELTIFDAKWSNRSQYSNQSSDLFHTIESRGSIQLDLRAGDLLIFQGGQFYHRVERAQGPIPRITLGGFITPSIDKQNLYFWS